MPKKLQQSPLLSVILPAYRQEKTIQQNVRSLLDTLSHLRYRYELIVVVDGILDNTLQIAKKIKHPHLRVIGYPSNKGKGYAVRYGMANSRGDIIAFIDAGMDINPNSMSLMLENFEWKQADIIVGSKLHPLSKVRYPLARKIISLIYRSIVHALFGLSVRDTQVGLKVFKRRVLEDVLPRLLVKRFAFDIEILAVAKSLGYTRIYEAPVELTFRNWTSITSSSFMSIALRMLWDTLAVFYRLRILKYYHNRNHRKWRFDPELNFRINLG